MRNFAQVLVSIVIGLARFLAVFTTIFLLWMFVYWLLFGFSQQQLIAPGASKMPSIFEITVKVIISFGGLYFAVICIPILNVLGCCVYRSIRLLWNKEKFMEQQCDDDSTQDQV